MQKMNSQMQNVIYKCSIAFLDVNNFKLGKAFLEFENQSIEFAKGILLSLNVNFLWQNSMNFW